MKSISSRQDQFALNFMNVENHIARQSLILDLLERAEIERIAFDIARELQSPYCYSQFRFVNLMSLEGWIRSVRIFQLNGYKYEDYDNTRRDIAWIAQSFSGDTSCFVSPFFGSGISLRGSILVNHAGEILDLGDGPLSSVSIPDFAMAFSALLNRAVLNQLCMKMTADGVLRLVVSALENSENSRRGLGFYLTKTRIMGASLLAYDIRYLLHSAGFYEVVLDSGLGPLKSRMNPDSNAIVFYKENTWTELNYDLDLLPESSAARLIVVEAFRMPSGDL